MLVAVTEAGAVDPVATEVALDPPSGLASADAGILDTP